MLTGDGLIRGKLVVANTIHYFIFICPLDVAHVVGIAFHIGEATLCIVAHIGVCQPSEDGDEHSSCHVSVWAEGGIRSTAEQSTIYHKLNIFLCPVSRNICKCCIDLLVADAVGGKMGGSKVQYLCHTVIDRVCEPVYLTLCIDIDCLHISSLFICTENVRDGYRYTASAEAADCLTVAVVHPEVEYRATANGFFRVSS